MDIILQSLRVRKKSEFISPVILVYKEKVIKSINNRKVDVLIPNMGAACKGTWLMTLTLDSKMLKKIINKLNPKIIIPVHLHSS